MGTEAPWRGHIYNMWRMSKFLIYRFFSHRIAWLALVLSLGIGALFAHTMWTIRQEHWDYYLRTNKNLSSTLAKGLEWSLDAVDLSLQKTAIALIEAQVLEGITQDKAQHSQLNALWRDIDRSALLVLDSQGRVVRRAQGLQSVGKQFVAHDFFQAFSTHRHKGVFIGQPTKDLVLGEYVLPMAHAVYGRSGHLNGVVVGTLRMQDINAWLSSMNLGAQSGVNIIREDGLILLRFPYLDKPALQTIAGSRNLARFLATPQGSFVGTAVVDGVRRLYMHHRVGHFPLVVNIAQSTQTITQVWVRNAMQLGVFAALLMLSCIGLAVLFNRELTRREATETDLFAEKERMRLTLQSIGDAVVCTDAQGNITYLNPVARQLTGLEMRDVHHCPIEVLHASLPSQVNDTPHSSVRDALASGQMVKRSRTTLVHRISKEQVEMEESASLVKSADSAVLGAVTVLRDITAAAAQEARMHRLAFYDALTGLPNRLLLQDRAMQAMAVSKRNGEAVAVIYLDLDRFKHINDSLGHQVGDAALMHISHALQKCVRESDTVCRLGGDEFVVLLPSLSVETDLPRIAEKIQQACAAPFVWEGESYILHASGGAALYPRHATQWDALLHCADMAMYAAKQSGGHQIHLYAPHAKAVPLARIDAMEHAD